MYREEGKKRNWQWEKPGRMFFSVYKIHIQDIRKARSRHPGGTCEHHVVSNVTFISCGGCKTCISILTTERPSDFITKINLSLALVVFSSSFLTCSLRDELHCLAQLPKSELLSCSFGNCETEVLGKNVTRQDSLAGSARDPPVIR